MALIKCSECGKEISEEAKKCPHCGITLKNTKMKKISITISIFIVLIAIVIFAIFKFYTNSKMSKYDYIEQKITTIHNEGLQDKYKNICISDNETEYECLW